MNFPATHQDVKPEEVRIVEGQSGAGLQVTCNTCGCVNWCHVEIREATWRCRNCQRVFTHYFPGLAKQVLALQAKEAGAQAAAAPEK